MGDNLLIKEVLQDVAKSIGFSSFEITVAETNSRSGYMSEVVPVTLTDRSSGQVLKLVIKWSKGSVVTDEDLVNDAYTNEIFFFTTIFPLFQELGDSKELAAKYYFSSLCNVNTACLVLEDLRAQGFEILDKTVPFKKNIIEFVFKRYGKLHALGYALKQKKPEFFKQIPEKICDFLVEHIPKNKSGLHSFIKARLIEDVKPAFLSSEPNSDILRKLDDYIENFNATFLQAVSSEDKYRTFLHGDCWSNNIMFKIEQGEPTDVRFVDWQVIRIGSPACDLSFVLYSSCRKEVLDDLEQLLKLYHASLSLNLKNLGCNAEEILPFEELLRQWRSHAKFGMMLALTVLKAKLAGDKELFKDGSLDNSLVLDTSDAELYKKAVVDLLKHVHEWDAL